MKKIISMGIASAVLALSAVSAFAENAAEPVVGVQAVSEKAVTGETYVVEIAAAEDLEAIQFCVDFVGLEYVSAEACTNAIWTPQNAQNKNLFAWVDISGTAPIAAGTTLLTLTCTVTAAEGEAVGVKLSEDDPAFSDLVKVELNTVAAAGDGEDLPSDSGSESGSDSTDTGDNTTNPPTGIALAIVPAVLAGAGVVVAKKRK